MKNITLSFAVIAIALFSGCAHQKTKPDLVQSTEIDSGKKALDSDSNNALGLKTIHFGYDEYTLSNQEKATLKENVALLKTLKGRTVQIEGHCDKRGSVQYNLALGEKRAASVKKFLIDHGISKKRLSTISYGKEKLLDNADTEEANAKNRRANFLLTN